MKHLFVKNTKVTDIGVKIFTGPQQKILTNTGPEGSFVSDTDEYGEVAAFCVAPSPSLDDLVQKNETSPATFEGSFVVEINGVLVPYVFTEETLPQYFKDGNETDVIFIGDEYVPPVMVCAGAMENAKLGVRDTDYDHPSQYTRVVTIDVYINGILNYSNVDANVWYFPDWVNEISEDHSISVVPSSSRDTFFYNGSDTPKQITLVPKQDGLLHGVLIPANGYLIIDEDNENDTVMKDPETGVINFCLGASTVVEPE